MSYFPARYPGRCIRCDQRFPQGHPITRSPGGWAHLKCPLQRERAALAKHILMTQAPTRKAAVPERRPTDQHIATQEATCSVCDELVRPYDATFELKTGTAHWTCVVTA